jgi:hypothetical protein
MKIPNIKWIPFDKSNPPAELNWDREYLIFLREDHYDNGATWDYSVDIATPFGDYIDDFWDTDNDWCEGQRIEVIAYAEIPQWMKESDLVEATDA